MTVPRLYDAVTLRHFGTIARLDVLEARCKYLDPPYWTQAVYDEISTAVNSPGCRDILAAIWLASPLEPQLEDMRKILAIQIGLNDGRRPPVAHAGEAEGIYLQRNPAAGLSRTTTAHTTSPHGASELGEYSIRSTCCERQSRTGTWATGRH